MRWVNRVLLGSAAGIVAIAGAEAADLPVKAKPVEYVKICSAYGAGFYYIPGTDICLRVGGYAFIEAGWNARNGVPQFYNYNLGDNLILNNDDNLLGWRTRGLIILDARSQTAIGTVRTYIAFGANYSNNQNGAGPGGNVGAYLDRAFIQFAGFTAGYSVSLFDFSSSYSIYTLASIAYHWAPIFAYTAQFANGFSASISIEDGQAIRTRLLANSAGSAFTGVAYAAATDAYGGQVIPDIVANLRVSQAWGSAQISGALHQIRVNQAAALGAPFTTTAAGDQYGWAVLGGIEIKTPMIAPGDSITLQGVYADGAVEYTGLSSSQNSFATAIGLKNALGVGPATAIYDAFVGGIPGFEFQRSKAWSANLMFRHFWQSNLRSAFWVGYNRYEPGFNGTAYPAFALPPIMRIWQAGGNVIWSPAPTLDLSLDVLWTRLDTEACPGAAVALTNCNQSADIWSAWTRWRRNF